MPECGVVGLLFREYYMLQLRRLFVLVGFSYGWIASRNVGFWAFLFRGICMLRLRRLFVLMGCGLNELFWGCGMTFVF